MGALILQPQGNPLHGIATFRTLPLFSWHDHMRRRLLPHPFSWHKHKHKHKRLKEGRDYRINQEKSRIFLKQSDGHCQFFLGFLRKS
jgi:hypothetical protein